MKTRFANLILTVAPLFVGLSAAAVLFPAFAPASPSVVAPSPRFVPAGEWQCQNPDGCIARINDGEGGVEEVSFRKGDIVSEENGWVVTPADGWKKLRNPSEKSPKAEPPPESWLRKLERWLFG
jgi:hypothetical protein